MSRRRRYARQGASRILATPRSFGAGGGIVIPPTILSLVASSVSSTAITVTGTTDGDISAGVFGVEFSINSVPNPPTTPYQWSWNTPGAAASQSISIVLADWVIVAGDTVYIRAYYNFDPLDNISTRVYGTPTLTLSIGTDGLLLGQT